MGGTIGKKTRKKRSRARTAPRRGGPPEPRAYSIKVTRLGLNGVLTPSALSDDALKAIEQLSETEINTLIRVNAKVPLGAFFKAFPIQWW